MTDEYVGEPTTLEDAITRTIKRWQETWPHPPEPEDLSAAIMGLIERWTANEPE